MSAHDSKKETALQKAERAKTLLAAIVESSPEAVACLDLEGNYVIWNRAAEKLFGYKVEEILGKNATMLIPESERATEEKWMDCARGGGTVSDQESVRFTKSGERLVVLLTISPIKDANGNIIGISRIIREAHPESEKENLERERKAWEERTRQAQKMEAVGLLTAGVAHDFNNMLAAILMHLGEVRRNPGLSAALQSALKDVENETMRATALTRQLLRYSRKEPMEKRPLDLNQVTYNVLGLLKRLLGENIKTVFEASDQSVIVLADEGTMEQVVMNLCINARDAMPNGGTLTLKIKPVELKANEVRPDIDAKAGRFARLTVTDTGSGIKPGVLNKIFEPFFSTKAAHLGTGLGLSTVNQIVKEQGGWLGVQSEEGKGSSFEVYLPALKLSEPLKPEVTEERQVHGGSEMILLVEDEVSVRRITALCLRKLGYAVLEARDGDEALTSWKKHRREIQLLLTDMVLPSRLNGLALAEKLWQERPKLQVVLVTGYMTEPPPAVGGQEMGFLAKPFNPNALAQVVREYLDRNPMDVLN